MSISSYYWLHRYFFVTLLSLLYPYRCWGFGFSWFFFLYINHGLFMVFYTLIIFFHGCFIRFEVVVSLLLLFRVYIVPFSFSFFHGFFMDLSLLLFLFPYGFFMVFYTLIFFFFYVLLYTSFFYMFCFIFFHILIMALFCVCVYIYLCCSLLYVYK